MSKSLTIFLQVVIVLIGIASLVFMLWEPHLEGRNVHATVFEIYFKDPFLAYAYFASLPFFVALYQAFQVLGFVRRNRVFSSEAVKALRTIKYCAICIIGFVVGSVAFMPFDDPDDRPPGVVMRLAVTFGSVIVVSAASVFERLLRSAIDMKSENDLTV